MLKSLQKHAPSISVLLLAALIVALFFSPPSARLLSTVIIVFGVGTAILFTIHSNWKTKQNDEFTNAQFAHNTIIDLLGLALIMGSAVWLGRLTGFYVGRILGNVLGIVAAMAAGFIAAFLAGKVWGKFAEPMKVKAA